MPPREAKPKTKMHDFEKVAEKVHHTPQEYYRKLVKKKMPILLVSFKMKTLAKCFVSVTEFSLVST